MQAHTLLSKTDPSAPYGRAATGLVETSTASLWLARCLWTGFDVLGACWSAMYFFPASCAMSQLTGMRRGVCFPRRFLRQLLRCPSSAYPPSPRLRYCMWWVLLHKRLSFAGAGVWNLSPRSFNTFLNGTYSFLLFITSAG